MELNKIFIKYRNPNQVIYFGDKKIHLFGISKSSPEFIDSFEKNDGEGFFPEALMRKLVKGETGVVLNPGYFVYNLLVFDKLPLRKSQRDELVNWRVGKIFPENIENHIHDYTLIDKNSVLSILFRRDLRSLIESEALKLGINLVYLGNSTIEILNSLRGVKTLPDFIIEADGNVLLSVFFNNGRLVYIRKMITETGFVSGDEIKKTVAYVEKNYGFKSSSCSLFSAGENKKRILSELIDLKFDIIRFKNSDIRFLPGIK